MRYYVIPEIFFKSIAEKGKLYSRLWFYWLSEHVDEIFDDDFIEKQEKRIKSEMKSLLLMRAIDEFKRSELG